VYIDDVGKLCDFRNGSFVLLYADDILLSDNLICFSYKAWSQPVKKYC